MLNEKERNIINQALYTYFDSLVKQEAFILEELAQTTEENEVKALLKRIETIKQERNNIIDVSVKVKGL